MHAMDDDSENGEPGSSGRRRDFVVWVELFSLRRASPVDDRLALLSSFGFSDRDLARVVPGAGPEAIERWRTSVERPSSEVVGDQLDLIWVVVQRLLFDGGYDERGIVGWVCTPRVELSNRCPIDLLASSTADALEIVWDALDRHLE